MNTQTLEERLEYAKFRWMEALRNGTAYDAMYWQGYIDGLKVREESEKMKEETT